MRPRLLPALAASVVALAAATPARADTVVRGFATASVGVSDNATFQLGTGPQRVTTALFELRPGVALIVSEKRDLYLVGYALRYTVAAAESSTQTYANTVLARWSHEATPRDRLLFEATATLGRTSAFYLIATSGAPLTGATPQVTRFATGALRETWTRQMSPQVTAFQSLSGLAYLPLDDDSSQAKSAEVDVGLGAERQWKRDALRFDLQSGLIAYGSVGLAGAQRSAQQQVLTTLSARWRHDLAPRWQSDLSLGVAVLASVDQLGSPQAGPTAAATLRHLIDDGSFTATVSHTEASNIYFAETQVTDEGSFSAVVPLDRRRRIRALGSAAYGHSHNVTGAGLATIDAAYHYYRLDAGVAYIVSNGVRTSLHVQRLDQQADASSPGSPTLVVDSAFIDVTVVLPRPEVATGAPF